MIISSALNAILLHGKYSLLNQPKNILISGFLAAIAVIFVWSSWLVVSRAGATSALTIFDMTALRFGISGVLALPIVFYYKPWKTLSILRILLLSFILGPVYLFAVFGGFALAPVAHGGAFMNGLLPIMSLTIGYLYFKNKVTNLQKVGAIIILISCGILSFSAEGINLSDSWVGDLLFVIGGLFFSVYVVCNPAWNLNATHVLLSGSVINAIYYVPIWYFFLPSGLSKATDSDILLQALFQGLVPTFLGLLLIGYAARTVGSNTTSSMMAAVPGVGTILGVIFLGEILEPIGWIALLTLTLGIFVTSIPKRNSI